MRLISLKVWGVASAALLSGAAVAQPGAVALYAVIVGAVAGVWLAVGWR